MKFIKALIDKKFKTVDFLPPAGIYNNESFYEIKVGIKILFDSIKNKTNSNNIIETIPENESSEFQKTKEIPNNSQKALLIVSTSLITIETTVKSIINSVFQTLIQQKKNPTLALITSLYYKLAQPLDPPLIFFLRLKETSLMDYLKNEPLFQSYSLPSSQKEEELKKSLISKEIKSFFQSRKSKWGLCKKAIIKGLLEERLREVGLLAKGELEGYLFQWGLPLIQLHCGSYFFDIHYSQSLETKKKDKACVYKGFSKRGSYLEKEDFSPKFKELIIDKNEYFFPEIPSFLHDKLTVIDDLSSYERILPLLNNNSLFGVDLEGEFQDKSIFSINLIQISVIDSLKGLLVLVFDVFALIKNNCFNRIEAFLKEFFEDYTKRKLFFDCRKDSEVLHRCLGVHCRNVIDLALFHMFNESLCLFVETVQKHDLFIKELQLYKKPDPSYFNKLNSMKQPSLNETLEKYNAPYGVNLLKASIKLIFESCNEWKGFFLRRPLQKEFLYYAAWDVLDLIRVYGEMKGRGKGMWKGLGGNADGEGIEEMMERISRKYVKEGCKE